MQERLELGKLAIVASQGNSYSDYRVIIVNY